MYRKLSFLLLFVFFVFCSFSYGETVSQCDFLYSIFSDKGLSPQKQALDNTENFNFPYNIILENKNKSAIYPRIFISVEEALKIVPELVSLSKYTTIYCTANDKSILKPNFCAGTETAINSFSQEEIKPPIVILSINGENEKSWTLEPGSNGYITPSYCFRKLKNALESANVYSYIKEGSLALYKLNLVKENVVLSTILENNYPAIGIDFPITESYKLPEILVNFSTDYDVFDFKNKEVNYDSFTLFSKNYTISEATLTLIFVSIVGFSLFSICLLSFMFGRKKVMHKKTMVKYWYIAPVFFIITFLFFIFSQLITKWLFPIWEFFPQYAIIIKIIFAILLYNLVYISRKQLKVPSRIFIYSYLLNIISLVNIFVFSALDLPLLILFGLEFLIIYISQGFRKTWLLIISTILLLIPFVPTLFGIFANSDFQTLTLLVNGNIFVNMILSLLILPFVFMIMRIIISINRKHHSHKKFIIKLSINIFITILFILFTIFFNNFLEKTHGVEKTETIFIESDKELISYNLSLKEDIGFFDNILTLETLENVIYYDIKIYSNFSFPIYSANYPFDFFQTLGAAQFNLAENPPQKLELEFLSDSKGDYTIEINVYSLENSYDFESKNNIKIYTKSYSINKSGATIL